MSFEVRHKHLRLCSLKLKIVIIPLTSEDVAYFSAEILVPIVKYTHDI